MIKRTLGFVVLFVSFCCSTWTLAGNDGYFSKQHPLNNSVAKVNSALIAPTDIIINNATFNSIYVTVPAGNFTDIILPHGFDHILNNRGALYTRLVLQDPNYHVFYDDVFCPHASITVYGYSRNEVVVDTKSC